MDERELVFYKLLQGTMPFSRGAPPACGGICKLSVRLKPGCTSIFGGFPSNRLLRAIANKLLNHCKILPPTLNKAAMTMSRINPWAARHGGFSSAPC